MDTRLRDNLELEMLLTGPRREVKNETEGEVFGYIEVDVASGEFCLLDKHGARVQIPGED